MKNLEKIHYILGEEVYYRMMAEFYYMRNGEVNNYFNWHVDVSLHRSIEEAFVWSDSANGHKYWSEKDRVVNKNWRKC